MITKRLFGSDISNRVKKKLESRQLLAEKPRNMTDEINPSAYPDDRTEGGGESNEGFYTYNELNDFSFNDGGHAIVDLGSRTPWVRMWCGVELNEPYNTYGNPYQTVFNPKDYLKEGETDVGIEELEKRAKKSADTQANTLGAAASVRKFGNQFFIINAKIQEQAKKSIGHKIYSLGNNIFNQFVHDTRSKLGESTRDQVKAQYESGYGSTSTLSGDVTVGDVIPEEMVDNPYMKPAAGITGMSSTSEGQLGVIKRTTVNFIVHNWNDFDKIYLKYFLRPGAQIFVDIGWNTTEIYDPEDVIEQDNIEELLFGEGKNVTPEEESGIVYNSRGDLETIIGVVTNYSSKVLEDGSVECTVDLTSKNSALLGQEIRSKTVQRIKYQIETLLMWKAVIPRLSQKDQEALQDWIDYAETPVDVDVKGNIANFSLSSTRITQFGEMLEWITSEKLKTKLLTPDDKATLSGMVIADSGKQKYISWGRFEDDILNGNFGFGRDYKSINHYDKKKYFQVSLWSDNSFTYYHDTFIVRQDELPGDGVYPTVLLPREWDNTYNSAEFDEIGEILRPNREPKRDAEILKQYTDGDLATENPKTAMDKGSQGSISRIPIREVFINVDTITKAFTSNDTFKDVIDDILSDIYIDTGGVMNWKVWSGADDNRLSIIDENMTEIETKIRNSGGDQFFNNLFKFSVMSPNSIVKGYNMSFDFPTGALGSMYAIQGMKSTDQISISGRGALDQSISLENLERLDQYFVNYMPYIGSHFVDKLNEEHAAASELFQYFGEELRLDSSRKYTRDPNTISVRARYDRLVREPDPDENDTDLEEDEMEAREEAANNTIAENEKLMELLGIKVHQTREEYFKGELGKNYERDKKPTLLPLKLQLTIYGIGNISPGDCFRVDYIPEKYQNTVYFQVMRVQQNVTPDGWFTTLETQFRVRTSGAAGKQDSVKNKANNILDDENHEYGVQALVESIKSYPIRGGVTLDGLQNLLTNKSNPWHSPFTQYQKLIQKPPLGGGAIFSEIGTMMKSLDVNRSLNIKENFNYIESAYDFTANIADGTQARVFFPVEIKNRGAFAGYGDNAGLRDYVVERGFGYMQQMGAYWRDSGVPGQTNDTGDMPRPQEGGSPGSDPTKEKWGYCEDNDYTKGWLKPTMELKPPFTRGCGVTLVHGRDYTLLTHKQDPSYFWIIIEKPNEDKNPGLLTEDYVKNVGKINQPLHWRYWGPHLPDEKMEMIEETGQTGYAWTTHTGTYMFDYQTHSFYSHAITGQIVDSKDAPADSYIAEMESEVLVVQDPILIEEQEVSNEAGYVISPQDLLMCNMCHMMMNSGGPTELRMPTDANYLETNNYNGTGMNAAREYEDPITAGIRTLINDQHYRYEGTYDWWDYGPWYCNPGAPGDPPTSESNLKTMCEGDGFNVPFWNVDDFQAKHGYSMAESQTRAANETEAKNEIQIKLGQIYPKVGWSTQYGGDDSPGQYKLGAYGGNPTDTFPGKCKWISADLSKQFQAGYGENDTQGREQQWPAGNLPCGRCVPNFRNPPARYTKLVDQEGDWTYEFFDQTEIDAIWTEAAAFRDGPDAGEDQEGWPVPSTDETYIFQGCPDAGYMHDKWNSSGSPAIDMQDLKWSTGNAGATYRSSTSWTDCWHDDGTYTQDYSNCWK